MIMMCNCISLFIIKSCTTYKIYLLVPRFLCNFHLYRVIILVYVRMIISISSIFILYFICNQSSPQDFHKLIYLFILASAVLSQYTGVKDYYIGEIELS